MPMNGDAMGAAVAAAVVGLSEADKANPAAIWKAVCKVIVTQITATAQISTTGTAAAQTGTII